MTIKEDVSGMKIEVGEIKRILIGNGTKGLIRKMEEAMTAIIELKGESKIKNWVLKSALGISLAICGFLAAYVWYMHFGGN